jgi:hypothetical protein
VKYRRFHSIPSVSEPNNGEELLCRTQEQFVATQEVTQSQKDRVEEILRILDEYPPTANIENRRGAKRVNVRLALPVYLLSVVGHPAIQIRTRNISTSGVGFVSRRPFQKKEKIAVELFTAPNPGKLILAEVTFSRYVRDGIYEIGCTFLEAISRDESVHGLERIPQRWITASLPTQHHPQN